MDTTTTSPSPDEATGPVPLRRPTDDRMVAGVAAGVARYLDIDATVVRITFAVLAVLGGAGLPLYLAGWLLIPEDGSSESIAGEFTHQPPQAAA
ncbi:MAG TPA: PspC domain-containing protein [Mycobacteriales bacterium]|nr:PspC domain-containing protein [Mycobacteriales bacterium]